MRVTSIQLEIRDRPKAETIGHVRELLEQTRGSDLSAFAGNVALRFFRL